MQSASEAIESRNQYPAEISRKAWFSKVSGSSGLRTMRSNSAYVAMIGAPARVLVHSQYFFPVRKLGFCHVNLLQRSRMVDRYLLCHFDDTACVEHQRFLCSSVAGGNSTGCQMDLQARHRNPEKMIPTMVL